MPRICADQNEFNNIFNPLKLFGTAEHEHIDIAGDRPTTTAISKMPKCLRCFLSLFSSKVLAEYKLKYTIEFLKVNKQWAIVDANYADVTKLIDQIKGKNLNPKSKAAIEAEASDLNDTLLGARERTVAQTVRAAAEAEAAGIRQAAETAAGGIRQAAETAAGETREQAATAAKEAREAATREATAIKAAATEEAEATARQIRTAAATEVSSNEQTRGSLSREVAELERKRNALRDQLARVADTIIICKDKRQIAVSSVLIESIASLKDKLQLLQSVQNGISQRLVIDDEQTVVQAFVEILQNKQNVSQIGLLLLSRVYVFAQKYQDQNTQQTIIEHLSQRKLNKNELLSTLKESMLSKDDPFQRLIYERIRANFKDIFVPENYESFNERTIVNLLSEGRVSLEESKLFGMIYEWAALKRYPTGVFASKEYHALSDIKAKLHKPIEGVRIIDLFQYEYMDQQYFNQEIVAKGLLPDDTKDKWTTANRTHRMEPFRFSRALRVVQPEQIDGNRVTRWHITDIKNKLRTHILYNKGFEPRVVKEDHRHQEDVPVLFLGNQPCSPIIYESGDLDQKRIIIGFRFINQCPDLSKLSITLKGTNSELKPINNNSRVSETLVSTSYKYEDFMKHLQGNDLTIEFRQTTA